MKKSESAPEPLKDYLAAMIEQVATSSERGGDYAPGVCTGFTDLDRVTAGFRPGNLIVVAGRPAIGKTALSMHIIAHVALNEKLPVVLFNLETNASEWLLRLVGAIGRINLSRLRTGMLEEDEWGRFPEVVEQLQGACIHMDETPEINPAELRAHSRLLAEQFGGQLGLIVIDYLQLMSASQERESRAAEISDISRSLKALAKELKCPVMVLSQIGGALEDRIDKRPVLRDLGSIQEDADVILFLYRDEVHLQESPDAGLAEVIIAKQRQGPIGTVHLGFDKTIGRFDSLKREF